MSFVEDLRLTDLENRLSVAGGRAVGSGSLRVWDGQVHTAVFKMDNQQYPTVYIAHGTLPNVMWQPGWGRDLGKSGYMCMYGLVPSQFT